MVLSVAMHADTSSAWLALMRDMAAMSLVDMLNYHDKWFVSVRYAAPPELTRTYNSVTTCGTFYSKRSTMRGLNQQATSVMH
jgi:hypothetical protein